MRTVRDDANHKLMLSDRSWAVCSMSVVEGEEAPWDATKPTTGRGSKSTICMARLVQHLLLTPRPPHGALQPGRPHSHRKRLNPGHLVSTRGESQQVHVPEWSVLSDPEIPCLFGRRQIVPIPPIQPRACRHDNPKDSPWPPCPHPPSRGTSSHGSPAGRRRLLRLFLRPSARQPRPGPGDRRPKPPSSYSPSIPRLWKAAHDRPALTCRHPSRHQAKVVLLGTRPRGAGTTASRQLDP